MANILHYPQRQTISSIFIDISTDDNAAVVRKLHHKSTGLTSLYITAHDIEQGAAALNSFLQGRTPDIIKDLT